MPSIFDEMDQCADAMQTRVEVAELGGTPVSAITHRFNRDDLQIEFRQIVLAHRPELTREEWLDLFDVWISRYFGKLQRERAAAIADIIATINEYANANGAPDPFVCPCGAELRDPADPAVMAEHQPHYLAAKGQP